MKQLLLCATLLFSLVVFSQDITGTELLDKAIAYHDPEGNWETFSDSLKITMDIPEKPNRESKIYIDLPNEYFSVKAEAQGKVVEYIVDKDSVIIGFNGEKNPSEAILKANKLSKKRALLYKNYYSYLYGLPMKLKDEGTIIHEKVEDKIFKGKSYLVLKATYDKNVGKDTWYFYFNKVTYAMEVYQFYHDESKNDGEYILLSDEKVISSIKMPKIRAWYMNKDDKHLGTDILN
ncbi:DUF6503 family protein [Neotamlana laminarinivorans]|uniref:DUF6503 family protein n=1 Tax=Neotamlana laminarinivorans TaxID=2883124 RepID=A0A9X1I1R4_9FLAO|nr:DUF6503 family protein [Tamlana laminarinivorans]MCB4799816.1 DUF6503 family protein [Tamlana laminarinivorans]